MRLTGVLMCARLVSLAGCNCNVVLHHRDNSVCLIFCIWVVGGENVIEIKQVSFTYDNATNGTAIRDINVQIPKDRSFFFAENPVAAKQHSADL